MTEYRKTFKTCRNVWWISIAVLLLCWSGCFAQDDFQDDAGADTSGNDATNDMMDQDPNVVNPQKNQNSGFNIPDTIMDNQGSRKNKGGKDKKEDETTKSIAHQTVQAALQFGVLVGVALMVGILFMINVWADMLYTSIVERFQQKFSKNPPVDIENQDPATLVGSFKRYK